MDLAAKAPYMVSEAPYEKSIRINTLLLFTNYKRSSDSTWKVLEILNSSEHLLRKIPFLTRQR